MRRTVDTTALIVGLLFLVISAVGLWSAFGSPDWSLLGVALPLALVVIGVVGLSSTRNR